MIASRPSCKVLPLAGSSPPPRANFARWLLTWLHLAPRDVLEVHPRGDVNRPLEGVFGTRSHDRPNPIGLHRVTILSVDGDRMLVSNPEAVDGTPIVDVKPVLDPGVER